MAVFGGTIESIAHLMRKAWAVPLFGVSLVAILLLMSHALFMSKMIEVQGGGAAVMPILIVAIGAFLVRYSTSAKKKAWVAWRG